MAGALFASAMSYFLGADFWSGVEKKVGTAGPPIRITTITDIDRFESRAVHIPEFLVDRPIQRVPRPPNGNSFEGRFEWAKALGGVDAEASLIRVVVAGKTKSPVLLQGLRFKLVDSRPALKGTLLSYMGIGAAQGVRYIEVNLGNHPPTWKYLGLEGQPEEHFPLRVTESDTEVFDILAYGPRGDDYWQLALDYTADGEQHSATIDDDGEPFHTTRSRVAGQRTYVWDRGHWRQTD